MNYESFASLRLLRKRSCKLLILRGARFHLGICSPLGRAGVLCGKAFRFCAPRTAERMFPAEAQRRKGQLRSVRRSLILCLFLIAPLSVAHAQNWPSFRGPNASGIAEGNKFPTSWNVEKSQNILWRTTIPGLLHSSPIAFINRRSGPVTPGLVSEFTRNAYRVRLVLRRLPADGKLYLPSEDGDVFVVKAGPKFELLATNPMGKAVLGTPAFSDGMLILRADNFVYAVGTK